MNDIEKMLADKIPAVVANAHGYITQVNDQFLTVYDWQEENLIGSALTNIIPVKYHDAHNLSFSRFLQTGKASIFSQWVDLEIVTGKGETLIAKHFIISCQTPEGTFLAAQIKPTE